VGSGVGCCEALPATGLAIVTRCLLLARRDFFVITLALKEIVHKFLCWKYMYGPKVAGVGGVQSHSVICVWQSYDARPVV